MRLRRTAAPAVTTLVALALAACSPATSSTATTVGPSTATSGASTPAAPATIGSASASPCDEVATVTALQQGLSSAGQATGTTSESVSALQAYARSTKGAFTRAAAVESSNAFVSASRTLSAFTQGACRTASAA